jgi:hypothetical protein
MQIFFTLHNEAGQRIGDDSDYPFAEADLAPQLRQLCAEEVVLGDGQPAWLIEAADGPSFVRTAGLAD